MHLELRESQATTLGGDFHANSVTQTQDHFEALANFAIATSNDRGAMATLTETIKILIEKVSKPWRSLQPSPHT